MFVNSDFSDLLRLLGDNNVRYLVIGGYAGSDFDKAWERRYEVDFDGLPVVFISKADLITAKRASGRRQDLIDADLLSNEGKE